MRRPVAFMHTLCFRHKLRISRAASRSACKGGGGGVTQPLGVQGVRAWWKTLIFRTHYIYITLGRKRIYWNGLQTCNIVGPYLLSTFKSGFELDDLNWREGGGGRAGYGAVAVLDLKNFGANVGILIFEVNYIT